MMDIYINPNPNRLTKFTTSSTSTKFKDILQKNISLMIMKTILISMRIVRSHAMKQGSIPSESDKKSIETESIASSEFSNKGKAIVEQILALEERNKSKIAGLKEFQSGIQVCKHLSKVILNKKNSRKIVTEFARSIRYVSQS